MLISSTVDLAQADEQLALAEQLVAEQEMRIAQWRLLQVDTEIAEHVLQTFLMGLAMKRRSRDILARSIDHYRGWTLHKCSSDLNRDTL